MISRMRAETVLLDNLRLFVTVLFLLAYIKLVSSGGAEVNATVKLIRCRDNERRALLDFKEALVDEDGILSSWGKSQEEDCCQWKGIHCSNRTSHVTILDISGPHETAAGFVKLKGKVSPSLVELNHLKYLNLSNNLFEFSPIPEFVGSLSRLQYLDISFSYFSGKVPNQLGNLSDLRFLDLGFNFLTVENLDWLSHLRLLNYLDLSRVDLGKSTDWLQKIYELSLLTELFLSWCYLPVTTSSLLPLTNSSSSSLINLAVVDFSYNNLNSPLRYNWLFNLSSSLVQIDMSGNSVKGSIPEAYGSMASLEILLLMDCELDGELPKSFRNLSRLATLDLRINNFNGQLSEFLSPLAANEKNSLRVLNLCRNQFGGSLPDFTRFPFLREMLLFTNKLSGSFSEKFGQVSGLVVLDLSMNQLTGSFPNLTLFSSLKELRLQNNRLEDTIPEAYFSNLAKLKYLDLSFNQLALKFSFDWVPPFQLNEIRLQSCDLGPQFPKWLRSQRNFSWLDISGAGISDTIPLWFWDLSPRVIHLNISYNQIQGVIPDISLKFANFVRIDLTSNHLNGLIPSLPPNLAILHLSQNLFTGSVSFLCTAAYKFLVSLDLSDNQLSGELPDCWMNVDQLNFLNLANNNLSGRISTSIGFIHHLQILQLRSNNLSGELPSSMKNCTDLRVLDLSENELSGEVPTWIGTHLTSLIVFTLRKNEFFGSVPPHICQLQCSRVLDLSQNNMSGSIPNCINNLTSLLDRENPSATIDMDIVTPYGTINFSYANYVANAFLQWKGRELEYRKTLGLLKFIDLSSNRLVGKIPQEFASLDGLISLNLSSNNLTGNIIQKIGQMKMLEVLDLSRNQLSGEIPTGLANLTFLNVLDLSSNNLTGKIPSSTQLQSFNASVYDGNDKLCGLPLPRTCQDDEPPLVGHGKDENNEEGDERVVTIGLYVSAVLGFVTGFWGLCGPILLRSTWRHAYFRLLEKIKDWIYETTTKNMVGLQRKIYG